MAKKAAVAEKPAAKTAEKTETKAAVMPNKEMTNVTAFINFYEDKMSPIQAVVDWMKKLRADVGVMYGMVHGLDLKIAKKREELERLNNEIRFKIASYSRNEAQVREELTDRQARLSAAEARIKNLENSAREKDRKLTEALKGLGKL